MATWLTQDDVNNYGHELIDVTQRAALHAVAPELQEIRRQNAELQQRLAREARRALDQRVEREVPNYREVDRDPYWHRYLLEIDVLSGRPRQVLLNDAIASGDANRVAAFFKGFMREAGGPQTASAAPARARSASSGKTVYSRPQIAALYERHRRGELVGPEWAGLEVDIIRAGAEGRITNPVDVFGK
jgi:hypothetical protein